VEIPAWFTDAIAVPPTDRHVTVDGCDIHYLTWGDPAQPPLLFLHGSAAHAHWWDHIAPHLLPDHFCIAIDLSGHGDSGRRDAYPRELWADEVAGVIADAGVSEPPILVGHSMGGFVAIITAATYGDRLRGMIVVDSGIRTPVQDAAHRMRRRRQRPVTMRRTHASIDEGIARFRLMPRQECAHEFLMAHIARHGLRAVEGGYQWKWDGRVFMRISIKPLYKYASEITLPAAFIRGERSLVVPPKTAEYTRKLLGPNTLFIEIPGAHHHLLLDQPEAFVAAIRRSVAAIAARA